MSTSEQDRQAMAQLYRRYGPVVHARCHRILQDTQAAEDATHETFIRVIRYLDRVAAHDEALPLIRRIATNYCLNEVRDRSRRPLPVENLAEPPGVSLPVGGMSDTLTSRQLEELLVSRFPKRLRIVAWMHYVDGLAQSEVAEALGVSRSTVAKRLTEFRQRGRQVLDDPSPAL